MRAPAWLRAAGGVMALHVVLGGLIYFLYDILPLALAGGLFFLWEAGRIIRETLHDRPRWEVWAAALLSQVPGLAGTANVALVQLGFYKQNSLGDILDFLMETWHTALLPWVMLLPNRQIMTPSGEVLVLFFIALPFLSPLLVGGAVWVATRPRRRWPSAA